VAIQESLAGRVSKEGETYSMMNRLRTFSAAVPNPALLATQLGYAEFRGRSHDAVILVYGEARQRDRDALSAGAFSRILLLFNNCA
jgi:hypothetical protein